MEVNDFKQELFDPKAWINGITKNISENDDRDKAVVSLTAKLQIYFQQLNGEFENIGQNVIQMLPKINRDAEKLSEDARILQDKLSLVKNEIDGIKKNTSSTIDSLERIDKVKMELVRYKEALHEADKWTMLSNEIKAALDVRDLDVVIPRVITLQQSLGVLTSACDYEDKKLELESFKNQVEALASPILLQAFTSKVVEESQRYVQVFRDMDRFPQILKLYSQNQKSLLIGAWDTISDGEAPESAFDSFQNYYPLLISTWQEQVKWCSSVFSQENVTVLLLDMYKDLFLVLSPKFSKYIDNNLKQVSEPLALLLELKLCTQQFLNNLKSNLDVNSVQQEKLLSLAKVVYLPYKNHISKYGIYQEAALHPHLTSLEITNSDIMESVQNLASQNSKAFSYLDNANKLCINLTESCSYPGYVKAVACFLNAYLNQYRLINKEISENQTKHEEVNMFQMCLTVLQCLGNFINRLKQFDQECLANINRVKVEYTNTELHPFYNYPKLLLDELRESDFEKMIKNVTNVSQMLELKPVFDYVKDLCQEVYDTTYAVIFEPLGAILNTIGSGSMWDNKRGGPTSDLPDYSFVPQECITQMGQYLMNLPQLLDPFLLSKNPELVLALSLVGPDYSSLSDNSNEENAFAEIFLGHVARGTCKAYVKQILAIQELSGTAAKQLATDINYLGNVLEDMGFSLSKKLQEIVLLLKLSPAEYGSQCSVCSPQLVAAIRQMRNIVSG
ncbi:hypothetical protein RUM43_008546 [Polyplax serrata]|uniref:Conserved oligomeric Golgi complex subunit 7 n=1 Tax=Polyplax serrata TaxID=468196 RepID=A0AAN8P5Y9_POLSC